MYKIKLNTLIGQERRATILFLILLLSVIVMIDCIIKWIFMEGFGIGLLSPYIFLYFLIPFAVVLIKKKKPSYIKYMYFSTYLIVCFVSELVFFAGVSDYSGGNMAEVFFVLFSPIFVNKRYCEIVTIGIVIKYLLIGLLLQTAVIIIPLALTLVFSLVAFLLLNRFLGYIVALRDSYSKQFDSTLSTGMAIMNHTIKNEITKIQYLNNRITDLIRNRDIQDVDSMMSSIQQATSHMLSMSNRLQAKTGDIVLQEETHNLNSIVNSAVGMIKPNLQKNNVRCIQELQCNADIMCDQLQLQEALMNILMNAIESMEQSEGIVTIRLYKAKKDIVIEIEDAGRGIPSDIRARVFEPFFTTRGTTNNHGLGLSYCYNVIEKHGGTMDIHSEVNVGTKVLIRLPLHRIVHIVRGEVDNSNEHNKGITG